MFENMRRLDARGPASRRVAVDAEGATLGPDCLLVRRTEAGYRCLRRADAAAIQKVLCGPEDDNSDRLFVLSRGIARALDAGDAALAQIYGLRIPTAGLDDRQLKQLAAAASLTKANFNPDEPRLPAGGPGGGEWTDTGGNDAAAPLLLPAGATAAVAADEAGSIFGLLGRTALAGLADLAAGIAGPTAFLGVLFLPTNGGPVGETPLPGRPDLLYRYDQDTGVLDIYRRGEVGRERPTSSHVDADGLFHDAAGRVLGRSLGSSVLVDPDALPPPLGRSVAEARADAKSAEGRPQLCPAPSDENIAGRPPRAICYQQQIIGLPPGLEVKLNGVRFDGCRETDGTMLEAKGPGYVDKMTGPGRWKRWFTGVEPIKAQMDAQSGAAIGRRVEWHFAEPEAAAYFRKYAEETDLTNIHVIYTPAR